VAGGLDEDGLADDTAAVLTWAQEHCDNGCPWALWGHSLGCGVIMHTLHRHNFVSNEGKKDAELVYRPMARLDALVLEAPFTSIADVVRDIQLWMLPKAMADWLIKTLMPSDSKFENIKVMPNCEIPTLILHGSADTVIPVSHGAALFSSRADGKCEFKKIQDCTHSDICFHDNFGDMVREFFQL